MNQILIVTFTWKRMDHNENNFSILKRKVKYMNGDLIVFIESLFKNEISLM